MLWLKLLLLIRGYNVELWMMLLLDDGGSKFVGIG